MAPLWSLKGGFQRGEESKLPPFGAFRGVWGASFGLKRGPPCPGDLSPENLPFEGNPTSRMASYPRSSGPSRRDSRSRYPISSSAFSVWVEVVWTVMPTVRVPVCRLPSSSTLV